MPADDDFNPRSSDAMFSTILARLQQQDATLARIEAGVAKTNGRVTALETWKAVLKGKVALVSSGIAVVVSFAGWLLDHFSK